MSAGMRYAPIIPLVHRMVLTIASDHTVAEGVKFKPNNFRTLLTWFASVLIARHVPPKIAMTVAAAMIALALASRSGGTSSGITASFVGAKNELAIAKRANALSIKVGLEMAKPQIPKAAIGTSAILAARIMRCLG